MDKNLKKSNLQNLSIVIPVYNAVEETIACVKSLIKSDAGECDIFLMDDASDLTVKERLDNSFKTNSNIKIFSHFRNKGYTKNISMGIEQTTTEYVCILNSDTLLPNIWAKPILEKLSNNLQIAAIGPLSNAASYQSVPLLVDPVTNDFSVNNNLGFDSEERFLISSLLENIVKDIFVDVPILNGFCTIFRRSALNSIGGFDIKNFAEGYGEENDLCIRLKARGYRLCVSMSTFVHHQKSKSFGDLQKLNLKKKGTKTLNDKFGKNLMIDINNQLNENFSLNMIRKYLKLALDLPTLDFKSVKYLYQNSKKFSFEHKLKTTNFIKLSGGGTYNITSKSVEPVPVNNQNRLLLSTYKNGIQITLPKDFEVTLLSSAPIATSLISLSILSVKDTVCVSEWRPADQSKYDISVNKYGWPVEWKFPEEFNEIRFSKVFFINSNESSIN